MTNTNRLSSIEELEAEFGDSYYAPDPGMDNRRKYASRKELIEARNNRRRALRKERQGRK